MILKIDAKSEEKLISSFKGRKSMSLKSTEELCVMTMKKKTAKFEEKWSFHFKIDMRNLRNFDLST